MRFEFFIATRYLRAKRRQAVIGVITGISIAGVAAGVASLVVALAINNGFRQDLQDRLLGSTSHINLLRMESDGIKDWRPLMERLSKQPHVVGTAPAIYEQVLISRGPRARGAVLKGMIPAYERKVSDLLNTVKIGSMDPLDTDGASRVFDPAWAGLRPAPTRALPDDLELGAGAHCCHAADRFGQGHCGRPGRHAELGGAGHQSAGRTHSVWTGSEVQPLPRGRDFQFRLLRLRQFVGVHPSLRHAKSGRPGRSDHGARVQGGRHLPGGTRFREQLEQAAGKGFMATNWMEQNKALFRALRLERLVTFITIGLIVFVAALNILISLTMMVMEKTRDIAVLMSMGTRKSQVRRLFITQGLLIGVIGTAIGLVLGYALSWAGGHYHLLSLAPEVYSIDYVPFAPRAIDGVLVALVAIGISLVATLYPSWSAARILPAEALRYE